MTLGRVGRRNHRRGGAPEAAALAALLAAGCAGPSQSPATGAALRRVAATVREDIYRRPIALGPLLAGRAVLYFFRSDCDHCGPSLAAARGILTDRGAPALILLSREDPARLRAVFGPVPRAGLIVVSDRDGAVMSAALPTRYVPRVIAIERFQVRLDATGASGPGLADAVAAVTAGAGAR